MLHLLYALALLLLLCGACAILAERFTLSPALLPLPVLSGAVVVLYLCGVAVSCALALWLYCWRWPPCGSSGLCNTVPPGWPLPGKERPPSPVSRCF